MRYPDYALTAENRRRAEAAGKVDADWYLSPVPREVLQNVLVRRNLPAVRDTAIWFSLLGIFGSAGFLLWGSAWAILPFAAYGILYTSSSDSRWHETLHGTAFRSDWMNNVLYEIAAFMVVRESTPWRWSHMRHHSDTYIKGVDPEITVPRPPSALSLVAIFTNLKHVPREFRNMTLHAMGRLAPGEASYVPESQHPRMFRIARIYLLIYGGAVGTAVYFGTVLPLMYVILPSFYGQWLLPILGLPQHTALAEETLDHRLNTRTVYMNPVFRFLYWEMNYHIEHHMYPMVPYHQLGNLHAAIKDDLPPTYCGVVEAWREILPALVRQMRDPSYFVDRSAQLPKSTRRTPAVKTAAPDDSAATDGWVDVCSSAALKREDVLRFDYREHTFAVYRTADSAYYATDGLCTHGNAHLASGLVRGHLVECPKHNGRFDVRDGAPRRHPVCLALRTYPVETRGDRLFMNVAALTDPPVEDAYTFEVVSNRNVATYIKELVLRPVEESPELRFTPGDYLLFDIPEIDLVFGDFDIDEPYAGTWRSENLLGYRTVSRTPVRRNFSIASNPHGDGDLRFNVRIELPPPGLSCNAGVGSSYVFALKPGDIVTAKGPHGTFHPKDTGAEMIYLGGGAGMAPLRSHIAYWFETVKTGRRVSFWYGARAERELFYTDYFTRLAERFDNFTFHVALSAAQADDPEERRRGWIHDLLEEEYLGKHANPAGIEYYLCGPPALIRAATDLLNSHRVSPSRIAYDEF
ncbi:MAG: fatty acid desaturase [Pseudomonadota bacterium]